MKQGIITVLLPKIMKSGILADARTSPQRKPSFAEIKEMMIGTVK